MLYNLLVTVNLLHPKSSGTVRLTSSNAAKKPTIDPRYLENDDDVKILVDGKLKFHQFVRLSLKQQRTSIKQHEHYEAKFSY